MDIVIVILGIVLVLAAPKLWTRAIFFKYNQGRKDLPQTGGELASNQLQQLKLADVQLIRTQHRSHYDLHTKSVCLTDNTMNNHSLTALVRAAFEVGHALQDKQQGALSRYRQGLLELAGYGEKLGSGALLLSPFIALLLPSLAGLLLFCALISMLTGAMIELLVVPIEWQAGFQFALPLLKQSHLLAQDQQAVREILMACALSHFAYSLANLLDGRHWLKALGFKPRNTD